MFLDFLLHRSLKFSFDPNSTTIILPVIISDGNTILHTSMALDTGASYIILRPQLAKVLDLKPSSTTPVASATGLNNVPITKIPKVNVLDQFARNVDTLLVDLPEESGLDGLLGLSFLKQFNLEINFSKGYLTLG